MHRRATLLLSWLMLSAGLALIGRSLVAGGGPAAVGVVLGVLFCLVGGGRLYVELRR